LIFYLLMRAFFYFGDCAMCHSSLCLLVSGSYSKKQLLSHVMTQLRKSGPVSSRSSISANTSFRHAFWSSIFFGTIFAHTFLMFKSCVTIFGPYNNQY
jgi:hypothetical protein